MSVLRRIARALAIPVVLLLAVTLQLALVNRAPLPGGATPDLVLLLEAAAIEALAPHLPEHQSSVGTTIDIAHSAATLKGQTVTCTATVTEVDRRRIVFDIVATDGIDTVCTGSHERFVVDLEKFGARLAEKAEKVASS